MIFNKTIIEGAYLIEINEFKDERGKFSNIWNVKEFEEYGLDSKLYECNLSYNLKKGTIRGLHCQLPPYDGSKLIRCISGKIYDVILDLRKNSKSFGKWIANELDYSKKLHYVPAGCAHGFQTLEDDSEILYLMSQIYMPEFTRVIKWNDKRYKIKWPEQPTVISKKDS